MTALAAAWTLVVLWGVLRLRPLPAALRRRLGELRPAVRPRRARPVASLGRLLRRAAGRSPDPEADRRAGTVSLVLLAGVAVDALVGLAAATVVWVVLRRRASARRGRAEAELRAELPEAINLLALAAGAGLSVRLAVETVAPRLDGPIGRALGRSVSRMRLGVDAAEALEELCAAPGGESLRLLVRPLTDSLRYGSALGPALDRAAEVARAERWRQATSAARRVPLRLLFPLTLCVLPAFVLLTIVPTVAQSLELVRF